MMLKGEEKFAELWKYCDDGRASNDEQFYEMLIIIEKSCTLPCTGNFFQAVS